MRWSFVIAALGLAAPAAAQIQEVTLDEAIARALTVQPSMVQARGEAAKAGARRPTAVPIRPAPNNPSVRPRSSSPSSCSR